jgi:hypothetical protein
MSDAMVWKANRLRVFISHLSSKQAEAASLKVALAEYGIDAFAAHADITPTSRWENTIEDALRTCHSLVALLHPGFHKSNWTDQEVGFVMGRDMPVFAVHLGEAPYGFLAKFQAFRPKGGDLSKLPYSLFKAYCKHQETASRMAKYTALRFADSGSFAAAKSRFSQLEEITVWSETLSKIVRDALRDNGQTMYVKDKVLREVAAWDRDHRAASGSAST